MSTAAPYDVRTTTSRLALDVPSWVGEWGIVSLRKYGSHPYVDIHVDPASAVRLPPLRPCPLQVADAMQVLAELNTVHPGTTATFCPSTSQYAGADFSWDALYRALTVT